MNEKRVDYFIGQFLEFCWNEGLPWSESRDGYKDHLGEDLRLSAQHIWRTRLLTLSTLYSSARTPVERTERTPLQSAGGVSN